MMKKIIFATGNEHKMAEIRMILADLGTEVLSQERGGDTGGCSGRRKHI